MKSLWKYLVNHIRQDFHATQYSATVAFLIVCIGINYQFDFNDRFLNGQTGFLRFLYRFVFFSTAYYTTSFFVAISKKQVRLFLQNKFWFRSIFAIVVLSIDSSLPFLQHWISGWLDPQIHLWAYKVGVNLISLITVFFPLLAFYWFFDRANAHLYGLRSQQFDKRPYFQMLLIMLPILVAASFSPAFQRQYPMYRSTTAHVHLGVQEWVTAGVYELAYGLDFITVELLFRGFMVIGMTAILGRNAVLPMAVTYCFLHFGKPAGEAVSSVIGGYIPGVIALETRSIWGGIMVHVGIAWMMETIAFIQKIPEAIRSQ